MARYRTRMGSFIVEVYDDGGECKRGNAVILMGFPASLGENAISKKLVADGFRVFIPHYPGTYDSGGVFEPGTCISMVAELESQISKGEIENLKNSKKVCVSKNIDLVVGYSFGAFVAIHSLAHLDQATKLILLSPALTYGRADIDMGFREQGNKFIPYVQRTRPMTYRFGDLSKWEQFYDGALNKAPSNPSQNKWSICALIGSNDSSINAKVFGTNATAFFQLYAPQLITSEIKIVEGGGHSMSGIINQETDRFIDENIYA